MEIGDTAIEPIISGFGGLLPPFYHRLRAALAPSDTHQPFNGALFLPLPVRPVDAMMLLWYHDVDNSFYGEVPMRNKPVTVRLSEGELEALQVLTGGASREEWLRGAIREGITRRLAINEAAVTQFRQLAGEAVRREQGAFDVGDAEGARGSAKRGDGLPESYRQVRGREANPVGCHGRRVVMAQKKTPWGRIRPRALPTVTEVTRCHDATKQG